MAKSPVRRKTGPPKGCDDYEESNTIDSTGHRDTESDPLNEMFLDLIATAAKVGAILEGAEAAVWKAQIPKMRRLQEVFLSWPAPPPEKRIGFGPMRLKVPEYPKE